MIWFRRPNRLYTRDGVPDGWWFVAFGLIFRYWKRRLYLWEQK